MIGVVAVATYKMAEFANVARGKKVNLPPRTEFLNRDRLRRKQRPRCFARAHANCVGLRSEQFGCDKVIYRHRKIDAR